ncbi:LpqN/LpqT family lipoprotein [Mycobacterium sp.]|uniref:LpqN/LpqT family lipoprotein n=1 Tax=Mycobacterium sp. TaxID=1785 RepID=UPI002BFBC836|nr:LpqN/LpqT family lipoprotein [Mycobacterium sp.]HME46660.1 LpqN/LpqT family lipoprotein [Mycobacterium sp.]
MKLASAVSGVAVAALALSFGLAGCGSGAKSNQASTTTTTTTTTKAQAKVAPRIENAPGPNPTIATYIQDNGITETPVHRGDPGAPTINLPTADGWVDAGQDTPDWAYSAIVFNGPEAQDYTPSIVALVSKLTGNVDQQKILQLAPGELNNLPGFKPMSDGSASTLGNFPAYQLGGTWVQDGQTKLVAQKTVVIPGSDGVYVLQLNADGLEDQLDTVAAATMTIDDQTTITP